jgi:23S rRNA (adenine-N6)-dimethyltransferase
MKFGESIQYSQNFLKNPSLVRRLIALARINKEDVVYEIGAGTGIITRELVSCCKKVIAIEKDKRLYKTLKRNLANFSNLELRLGDFLTDNLPREKYKIFSNIPFQLTAEIIKRLLSISNSPEEAFLVIQKEAAKKFAGKPYAKRNQLISLLFKPWFEFKIIYHFQPSDFQPVPQVEIVLLKIKKRKEPLIEERHSQLYRDFIVYGFTNGSTIKQAFKRIFTNLQLKRLARDLKFFREAKPVDLELHQWLGLFDYFLKGVEEFKKNIIKGSERKLISQQRKLQKIHRTRIKQNKVAI